MVEQLIKQIDVYGADRVEICWKFKGTEEGLKGDEKTILR